MTGIPVIGILEMIMLIRLSKNAVIRQYGDFTYVLERISSHDEIFRDAEVFFRWITREAIEEGRLVELVCSVYAGEDGARVREDLMDFLELLEGNGIIVRGNSEEDLSRNDRDFSYDAESPKTWNINEHAWDKSARIPSKIVDEYHELNPSLFSIQVEVTQACTERCIHCYCESFEPRFMPVSTFKKIAEEFRAQGGVQIGITGGECLLHPEFEELVKIARENDLIVAILSNLTLCNEDTTRILKDADAIVQVSLYSMKPEVHDAITRRKGSHAKTLAAIEMLRSAHIPCLISCPTMKANYGDYLGVLEYARSLKMDAQTDFIIMGKRDGDLRNTEHRLDLLQTRKVIEDIVYRSMPVNSEYFSKGKTENLPSPEEWAGSHLCGACRDSISVDVNGYYHPCPGLGGIALGNCKEHDLGWVLHKSPEMKKMRDVKGRNFPKCVECDDRDYCAVCMCRNFNETGDLFTPAEHFCKVARINHEVVDEYQRRMAK